MPGPGLIHSSVQYQLGIKIDAVQYQPTQRPIEDRFSVATRQQPERGHGGPATAEHISHILPITLLAHPPEDHSRIFKEADDDMIRNFARDHSMLRSKSKDWIQHAQVVKSGCTALILDIDIASLLASFANAGDCRAVLFDPSKDELQLTEDLNGKSPSEQTRLAREHPNEDTVIVGGRLFGRLMSTRGWYNHLLLLSQLIVYCSGFGDAYYKLPYGLAGKWQHKRYINALSSVEDPGKITMSEQYDAMFHHYRTPPYVTAAPDVGIMQLRQDAFVIMASDGLWDCVSSEVAVGIVRQGIEQGVANAAEYLLRAVMDIRTPGDDVTILVVQVSQSRPTS
ncbi:hypothetical protein H0H81_010578 [Sphagnurus paluster]|uniref:PPM-type phosphatase domain-containing protein n=1 Tax=Sphagnurus paluster TaxID=117069 RepID=A0A9P7FRG8_9AGAR|nr:hypothetical protein H0H81_010578 [Sphagnurus paluster]